MGNNTAVNVKEPPYGYGTEARGKRWKEIRDRGDQPIEVNCFGAIKYKILGRKLVVRIFNEKIGIWQEEIGVEYEDLCPICGKLMLVRAIQGTTWLACCSKPCYDKYSELKNNRATNVKEGD